MRQWRPALLMARRDLWRHRWRTALVALLVALPVLVGTVVAQIHHDTRWVGENEARATMGGADALVEITRYAEARPILADDFLDGRAASFHEVDGRRRPVVRPRTDVDLPALLPWGSRVIPARRSDQVGLAGGGSLPLTILDVADPMARGLASIGSGRAPRTADQAAVSEPVAAELGMLSGGSLRPDATLPLADGTALHVVGLVEGRDESYGAANVLVASTSRLAPRVGEYYLVDLPTMTGASLHTLAGSLAGQGVVMLPRDAIFHPAAWAVRGVHSSRSDPAALALGALCVLLGLVEVVLLVGSAFAVGARRQVRDLGLVAASGGAPSDVRRVLWAQGLVVGVGASVVGAAAGIGLFLATMPLYERLSGHTWWSREIDWIAVAGLALLGSITGLVAALIPAWSIGRLTPVAALSGRFPVRTGESRAHRPAFVVAALGLLFLAIGGWSTARAYAPRPRGAGYYSPSSVPVVVGALGLLLLIGGAVWSAPYVVRRLASVGQALPLSPRLAFRDAARNRFRTAAAAVALTMTVSSAVLAGFVVNSVTASMKHDQWSPPHSMTIYPSNDSGVVTARQAAKILATVRTVVGPVRTETASRVFRTDAESGNTVGISLGGGGGDYNDVKAVSVRTLRYLVTGDDTAAVDALRSGAVVMVTRAGVHAGSATLALYPGQRRPQNRWTLPAYVVSPAHQRTGDLSSAWVSVATAHRLGLRTSPETFLVRAQREITSDDLTRLSVHGISTWSPDIDAARVRLLRLAALGLAGLLAALVVGIAVSLAGAEGRNDVATMAAVGAGPWRRRGLGAMHGLFLGVVGALLGLVIGLPGGAALTQVDGLAGAPVPWLTAVAVALVVPLFGAASGWLATPGGLSLVRRTD